MPDPIGQVLAECLSVAPSGKGQLILAATLQGFPETAHGGGVLAPFDQVAARILDAPGTPRTVKAQIQRTIPLQTSLALTVRPSASEVTLTLGADAKPLARGLGSVTA